MPASFDFYEAFPTTAGRDVAKLVLGNLLGYGTTRAIYQHALDPGLIVKIEDGAQSFCNIAEWSVWEAVKETALARWFAPAVAISQSGTVIVMKRCEPLRPDELPERIPAFFTDVKAENWGLFEGRPVCLDYGYHLMLERGMTKAMRKANWRD